VKTAIPLGTILLVAAAALHRSAPPAAEGKPRTMPSPVVVRQDSPVELRRRGDDAVQVAVAAPAPAPVVKSVSPEKPVPQATWRKLIVQVDRSVELSAIQRSTMEQFLRERDDEIRALHESIVRAGVIDIRRYDWQADTLKEGWFRKIDALLDRAQHEKFMALVQQGILNEGLAFTVEPGMTVLD